MTIKKGDRIEILPEWQDAGDDTLDWIAVDDEEKGRVGIMVMNQDRTFPAWSVVEAHMVRKLEA